MVTNALVINRKELCGVCQATEREREEEEEEEEEEESDSMVRRRADLGFKGVRSVLVDCTTASPLAKEVKDYKPGKAAAATKRKVKDYQRFYDIQQTNRCSIFFFAVETTARRRDYVKLLAKLAGGTLRATILRIYQTLAVEFQCARANQVYITNRKYVTSTPPLPHPIPTVTKKLAIFK
jgi:hypothetical protein